MVSTAIAGFNQRWLKKLNKIYAASLIQHLQKENTIEIIEQEEPQIPEWQKEAVRKTLAAVEEHPEQLQPWDIVKQKYNRP